MLLKAPSSAQVRLWKGRTFKSPRSLQGGKECLSNLLTAASQDGSMDLADTGVAVLLHRGRKRCSKDYFRVKETTVEIPPHLLLTEHVRVHGFKLQGLTK